MGPRTSEGAPLFVPQALAVLRKFLLIGNEGRALYVMFGPFSSMSEPLIFRFLRYRRPGFRFGGQVGQR